MHQVTSISIFDIIKIGIGPSSSHTMGAWNIGHLFIEDLKSINKFSKVSNLYIHFYGSFANTGTGHGTNVALVMGLLGHNFETIDTNLINDFITQVQTQKNLNLNGELVIPFDFGKDIFFHTHSKPLPYHPNGTKITASFKDGSTLEKIYYSVGGGFVLREGEKVIQRVKEVPHLLIPCSKWLNRAKKQNKNLSDLVLENELQFNSIEQIQSKIEQIFEEIKNVVFRGLKKDGVLPGGLNVERKAHQFATKLLKRKMPDTQEEWEEMMRNFPKDFYHTSQWITAFAMAVNEENASFGRVITAPTNGASGVLPATLLYAYFFLGDSSDEKFLRFFLSAGQVGIFFKETATISGAKGGCQAEIGVSSAMVATALSEWLGGTPEENLLAGSITMSNHLGMTCDPVAGLVQIPCIERTAMGALKAVNAAYMSLGYPTNKTYTSLDSAAKAMWQIANDMDQKYRETSKGGLASFVIPKC